VNGLPAGARSRTPRVATAADASRVTTILVDAFADDPMWGAWAFPDPHVRRAQRTALFRVLVEGALHYPWVWLDADEIATTVWIPPGGSELTDLQEHHVDMVLRDSLGPATSAVLHAFEMFAEAHPSEPHYYLSLFGTAPGHAGRGVGQRLLTANLAEIDVLGVPAYLEASDELVTLYERFGFRRLHRFALEGGPTVNGMWREPPASPTPSGPRDEQRRTATTRGHRPC